MEIKSYKADPSLNISDKPIHDLHITGDSNARPSEDHPRTTHQERKSTTKKYHQDENKNKLSRPKTNESLTKKTKIQDQPQEQALKKIEGAKMQEIEAMIEALDPNFNNKKKALEELQFIFDAKSQSGNLAYHQDGNMEFYTQENEKRRTALKSDPLIIEALNKVIDLYQFDPKGQLTKQEYIKMHTIIAKSIRKDLGKKSLTKLVEQDWKHDSKSKGIMEREELFNSLFELGDVWTPEINVFQYVAFFQKLHQLLIGETDTLGSIPAPKDNPYDVMS